MKQKLFILVLLIVGLTGCETLKKTQELMRPMAWLLDHHPPGPFEYEHGWAQGCESGMGGMSNDYYKSFYQYRIDVNYVTNETYYKAWKDAYNYCRHYVYGNIREGDVRTQNPNAAPRFFVSPFSVLNFMGPSPRIVENY